MAPRVYRRLWMVRIPLFSFCLFCSLLWAHFVFDCFWYKGGLTVESTAKAEELYNPVLDSRAKAERLRATLIILQRHKEYFNLPSLIANEIKKVPSRPVSLAVHIGPCLKTPSWCDLIPGRIRYVAGELYPRSESACRVHGKHSVDIWSPVSELSSRESTGIR